MLLEFGEDILGELPIMGAINDDAVFRLRTFVERAAISTLTGDIFDDAATGQGLLNFFLKALNCGAISEEEILATGLTLEEVQTRSFFRILEGRRAKAAK